MLLFWSIFNILADFFLACSCGVYGMAVDRNLSDQQCRLWLQNYRTKAEFYADMATRESTAKQFRLKYFINKELALKADRVNPLHSTPHQEFEPYKDQLQHFLSYKLPLRCLRRGLWKQPASTWAKLLLTC
jgi:hypothetical protein